MCAFIYHRLEVSVNQERLFIRKKPSWKPDEIAVLWDVKLASPKSLFDFLRVNPDLNHLRFYRKDDNDYEIVNSGTKADWPYPDEAIKYKKKVRISSTELIITKLRDFYLRLR